MRNVINLAYLGLYVCATLIQYAHPPAVSQIPYAFVWAIAAFTYPLVLAFGVSGAGFWKGMLTILFIPVIAQALECFLYLWRTDGFQHGDSDTVVFLAFYLIAPLTAPIIWYPLGYLVSRLVVRKNSPRVFGLGKS